MSGLQNYTAAQQTTNQGIVDGRQDGANPPAAPVTLDTHIDRDASAEEPRKFDAHSELPGATSKDAYNSIGQPGSGMTSTELHHNAQHGRKKEGFGVEAKYGLKDDKDVEL